MSPLVSSLALQHRRVVDDELHAVAALPGIEADLARQVQRQAAGLQ